MDAIDNQIKRIDKYVSSAVKEHRYEHSVRVAQLAEKLCKMYGFDEKKGYLAGIAHDMCKDMSDSTLLNIVSADGLPVQAIEKNKPSLLHGRAAAVLLKRDFGVIDDEVLEAVQNHTFGKPGMKELAQIIFIADKIEPGRPQVTEVYYKRLFSLTLQGLMASILKENIEYLEKRGKIVSPLSIELFKSFDGEDIG